MRIKLLIIFGCIFGLFSAGTPQIGTSWAQSSSITFTGAYFSDGMVGGVGADGYVYEFTIPKGLKDGTTLKGKREVKRKRVESEKVLSKKVLEVVVTIQPGGVCTVTIPNH